MQIDGEPGDAHPLGALADGTKVCCVERLPGDGARFATQAGGSSTILRRYQGPAPSLPSRHQES